MTLLKHHSFYDYALLMAVILYSVPINSFSPGNSNYHPSQVSQKDTTLPYQPTNDSFQKVKAIQSLARPEIRMNAAAVKFTQKFIKKNEKDLLEIQKRSDKFFNIIEPVLSKHDLPLQLKYLAVVESDLKAEAKSRVGAVGTWQLMRETALELGLTIKGKIDERKSIRKSSIAAAKYLQSLYKHYGDWLLVISAYNSGPGLVNAAIKKSGSKNFWKLQTFLPAETRGHVKRYVAIHYFFEGVAGVTTLTKTENVAYLKSLEQYKLMIEESSKSAGTSGVAVPGFINEINR